MDIILRTSAIFVLLFAITKGLGKRELSELTTFELLLLVVLGDLIQQGATQDDRSVTGALLAVSTLTGWILLSSWLTFRFARLRRSLEGVGVLVVRDGTVDERALRRERLTRDDLLQEARGQGIGNVAEIRYGILESDGRFSFVRRDEGGGSGSQ